MADTFTNIMESTVEGLDLSVLRGEIDFMDKEIVSLLEKRMQVVERVGDYKHHHAPSLEASGNKSFIRSGREASMIRRLVKDIAHYPPEAVIAMWRMIISSSLHQEKPLSVAVVESMEECGAYWLAREYFGAFVPIMSVSDVTQVMALLEQEKVSLAVVTLFTLNMTTGQWWELLARLPQFKVFARVPFYQQLGVKQDVGFAIAHVVPEQTDDDISLWVVSGDGEVIESLAKEIDLEVQWLMDGHGKSLVQVKGYWLDKESEAIQDIVRKSNGQIADIIPIGAYATPIIVEKEP